MPPTERKSEGNRRLDIPGSPNPPKPGFTAALLPSYRSEAIAVLTTKARALHAEITENQARIDALQFRNAAIRRELADISTKVHEHAWDGVPLPAS